jgi:uncharacterized protein (DUF2344 family)
MSGVTKKTMINLSQGTLHVFDARLELKPSEHKETLQILDYDMWSIYVFMVEEKCWLIEQCINALNYRMYLLTKNNLKDKTKN